MVVSSINKAWWYIDTKGNYVKVDQSWKVQSTTPKPTSTSTVTPTWWYDSKTNTYYDSPNTPKPWSTESQNLAKASLGLSSWTSTWWWSKTTTSAYSSIPQNWYSQQNTTWFVQQWSRYAQNMPSQESVDAWIWNPLKKKKKQYDQFWNEIRDITEESWQQQWTPQVWSDAWMQEKQRAEAEKQVNEQLLQPLDREMTMFDRWQENLDINQQRSQEQLDLDKQRALEDRQVQLENTRRDVARNIEDTSKARADTMQKLEKTAAVMWINAVSTYYDTYQKTMDKFNTAINRVQEDLWTFETQMWVANDRLNTDYDRAVRNMMSDYTMNTQRLQEDFNYNTRQYRDYMIREANVMVEKYWLSSEKLWEAIQTISLNAFKAVNDAYSSYLSNIDTQTDILDKQVNNIINTRTNMMKYEEDLIKNYVDSSWNLTINDLNAMVTRGEMSPQNAQSALSKVLDMAINTIDSASMEWVGSLFQDQIVEWLNAWFTPNQIIQNILKSPEYKEAVQQIASTDPFFATKLRQSELQNQKSQQDIDQWWLENDLEYRTKLNEYLETTWNILPSDAVKLYWRSAAVRNFNPGNITDLAFGWKKVPWERFTVFDSPQEWFQALVDKVIYNQTNPQSRYYWKTIASYFETYAPASDNNDPVRYANNVANYLWVDVNTPISQLDPYKFASEIARHEDWKSYKMLTDLWIIWGNIQWGTPWWQPWWDWIIDPVTWVDFDFATRVTNMIPATLRNSETEQKNLNDRIKTLAEAWLSPRDWALRYMWFKVNNENDKQFAEKLVYSARQIPWDVDSTFINVVADMVNSWDYDWAARKLENTVLEQAKKTEWENFISEPTTRLAATRAKSLNEYIDWLWWESPIWVGEWTMENRLWRFKWKEAAQIKADVTQMVIKMRKDIIGADITETENDTLEPLIPSITDSPANFMIKLNKLRKEPLLQYNSIRTTYWLPEIDENTLLSWKKSGLYKWWTSQTPVDIKTTVDRFETAFWNSPSAKNF